MQARRAENGLGAVAVAPCLTILRYPVWSSRLPDLGGIMLMASWMVPEHPRW